MDTTTGMSAPPMAMTRWMPSTKASSVITHSVQLPAWFMYSTISASEAMISARLNRCRPGRTSALPSMLPASLP